MFSLQAAFGSYLFLLGIFYCLPKSLALDEEWEWDHVGASGGKHIVIITSLLGTFTVAVVNAYLRDLFDIRKPRMAEHANDVSGMSRIHDALQSKGTMHIYRPDQQDLIDYVKEELKDETWKVKDDAPRSTTNAYLNALLIALHFNDTLEENLKLAAAEYENLTDRLEKWQRASRNSISMPGASLEETEKQLAQMKNNLARNQKENLNWQDVFVKYFGTTDLATPLALDNAIANGRAEHDPTEIFNILGTEPANRIDHSTHNIATEINHRLNEIMTSLTNLIPTHLRTEMSTNPTWKELLRSLKHTLRRMSTSPMAGVAPSVATTIPGTLTPGSLDDTVLETIRQMIPENYRPPPSASWTETAGALRHALGLVSAHCTHMTDLAGALGDNINQAWDLSIARVRNLLSSNISTTMTTPHFTLKSSDLPTFDGDYAKFPAWWGRIKLIVSAHEPAVEHMDRVTALILGTLKGDAAPYGSSFNLTSFREANMGAAFYEECMDTLEGRLRTTFQSPLYRDELMARFNGLRTTGKTWPEFKVQFDAIAMEAGISEEMQRDKLIRSMPKEVREDMRKVTFGSIESLSYAELLQRLPALWQNPRPAAPARRQAPAHSGDPSAAHSGGTSGRTAPFELPPACNGHHDRVGCPKEGKGKLGEQGSAAREAKIQLLRELGRCFRCRGLLGPGEPGSQSQTQE
jgi:hypothetical protein